MTDGLQLTCQFLQIRDVDAFVSIGLISMDTTNGVDGSFGNHNLPYKGLE